MTSRLIAKLTMSTCLATGALYGAMINPAAAITTHVVNDPQGTPFIALRFFDVGDGVFGFGDESEWNLSDLYKNQIIDATRYWAEVIKVVPGENPAIINVGALIGGMGAGADSHAATMLNGAMKGLPMRVATDYGPYDAPLFSHSELKNSLMSNQLYRNYSTLMEAELAAMQDIGYNIDRRNFYGNSIYGDELTIINNNPYFGRNAEGTAYIDNTYNTATLGLGLHVYGSYNTITQNADLLSVGAGGGIRIDGAANNLIVAPDVLISANGANGRGIMFAYGKDHTLTHRGDVQAMGHDGIAVSFDFGHNSRGDGTGYRGSYILELDDRVEDQRATIFEELNEALVSTFDLTGRVAGKKAGIFMSENALVGQINVMQGASIFGDIISDYYQTDEDGHLRLTELSFGLKPNEHGNSTGTEDTDLRLAYGGNIKGSLVQALLKMA